MKTRFLALLLGLAVVCGSKPARAADAYGPGIVGEEDDVSLVDRPRHLVPVVSLSTDTNGGQVATVGWESSEPVAPLATVGGGQPRVNFVSGKTDRRRECPSDRPSCRLKSYLMPGDAVLVGGSVGNFRCVTFRSPKGAATSGFVAKAALVEAPPTTPRLGDWTGEWVRDGEASITIQATDDALSVKGDATYGALDPERVRRGDINSGQIDAVARPRGNLLATGADYDGSKAPAVVDVDDCLVRLRLFESYLVVDDNNDCGGLNVTFTGVYSRRP